MDPPKLVPDNIEIEVLGDARLLDEFVFPRVRYLKRLYLENGNAYLSLCAASHLQSVLRQVPSAQESFNYAMLLSFMAKMLIALGSDRNRLEEAAGLVDEAEEIVHRVGTMSDELIQSLASLSLYRTVIQKALGNFDDAILNLRRARGELATRFAAHPIELTMLDRQEVIMLGYDSAYRHLIERASDYANELPVEYYSTIKRVFEYTLNKGDINSATTIAGEFKRAFRRVASRMPPLSHVSFAKNMGQFYLLSRKRERAQDVLDAALDNAVRLHLFGQQRQISWLIDDIGNSRGRGLITFRVP